MIKMDMRKKLTSLLLVSFALIMGIPGLFVNNINAHATELSQGGKLGKFALYNELITQYEGFSDKTVINVKVLNDFDANSFLLLECYPTGYIIYDNTLTTALELNAEGDSPYINQFANLIYGGPTQYYIMSHHLKNDNVIFSHTVLDETIIADHEKQTALREESSDMSASVKESVLLKQASKVAIGEYHEANASSGWQTTLLSSWSTIANLNTTGYNVNGNCGYVAASLITYYYYKRKGWSGFVPGGVYSNALVQGIQGSRSDSTWGPDLASAMSDWSYSHGANDTILLMPYNKLPGNCMLLPTFADIWSLINQDRPVALLGDMPSAGNHVITIHGAQRYRTVTLGFIYTYSDYYYWAHYGWGTSMNDVKIHDSISNMVKGSAVYY
ncbi:MAG: hypothetical protein LBU04_02930 [Christensenellaceae bacterium]|jgi:hypothetical protein|nr:hypothetical protein [Christensenellaceae bacterium]